jgi:arginine/lysine/ornithine decarboxylase
LATKTGLYSFYIMFTISIAKGRWATMDTELRQFKDDYDHPLWWALPAIAPISPLRPLISDAAAPTFT